MSARRGIVQAVLDGNTIVVKFIDSNTNNIAAIGIDYVIAPRLGTFDGSKPDEPHAYPAWEFLREYTLSERVVVHPSPSKSEFKRSHPTYGSIPVIFGKVSMFDKSNKDLAEAIVEAGWAKLRKEVKTDDDYVQHLNTLQEAAEAAKIGAWAPDGLVRKLPVDYEPSQLLKTKVFENALVESVINGSTLNVTLLPNFESIIVQLSGIRCPSSKRDLPEPFGIEAKEFTTSRLIQRKVKVILHSETENGGFNGQIIHPRGDIAIFLLEAGLAQIMNKTMVFVDSAEDYRRAELSAKRQKKNLWKTFDVSTLNTDSIEGRVISVKTSNSLEVETESGIKRLWLSGIKAPNFYTNKPSDPYGLEAREFLRQRLIGKRVLAVIDYTNEDRQFATVWVDKKCINEQLIAAGLATVFTPRNVNQSERIDAMMAANEEAKKKKLGVHNPKPLSQTKIVDLSSKPERAKSFPFLHFLENKTQRAVVEHFFASTRLVVLVPQQNAVIRLKVQGIVGFEPSERIGSEALAYCQSKFLNHDAEVHVTSVDKMGSYLGSIEIDGKSLEVDLLEKGYATIKENALPRGPIRNQMIEAENQAKSQSLGIWGDITKKPVTLAHGVAHHVKVMDVWDSVTAVVQLQSKELTTINKGLLTVNTPVSTCMKGDLVAAIHDDKVYRARITKVDNGNVEADLIDLLLTETIPIKNLRVLPTSISNIPPQAITVVLGGVKPFAYYQELHDASVDRFWNLVANRSVYIHLMFEDSDEHVLLTDSQSVEGGSINAVLVSEGKVRASNDKANPPFDKIIAKLVEFEEIAREERKGAWVYGDIGSDNEDDENY